MTDAERMQVIQECWDEINQHIKEGPLPGNGCDELARNGGMIIAANLLMAMMRGEGANLPKVQLQ